MIRRRISSFIMSFAILGVTVSGMNVYAAPSKTTTVNNKTKASQTTQGSTKNTDSKTTQGNSKDTATKTTAGTNKNAKLPVVSFSQKPYGEYVAGSGVYFKVASQTTNQTMKVQYSAKLFNLDTNKAELNIRNYGASYYGAQIIAFSFTAKNPGNYRLAVFVKQNGTNGVNKAFYESYDTYVTYDFKVINAANTSKTNVITVAPIAATVEQKSTYKLPASVNGKDSKRKTKKYAVTWDSPVDTTTPGAVVFNGKLKDPTTKKPIDNASAKLTLTIIALPVFEDINVSVNAQSAYRLPEQIEGTAADGGTRKYTVVWDGNVDTTVPGVYTFSAKTLKDSTTNKVVNNVTPKLVLTVLALPVFDTQSGTVYERDAYKLPATIKGKLYDGTIKEFKVAWDRTPDTTNPGTYSFKGTISDKAAGTVIDNVSAAFQLKVVALPQFDSIVASVAQGGAYTLPSAVIGKQYDGSTKSFAVSWDHAASTSVPGVFTFVGTIKDSATGVVINNTQVILTLTVSAVPTFTPIENSVVQGSDFKLPVTVAGTMYDGSTKLYNVNWDKAVDTSAPGMFIFTGTLQDPATQANLQGMTAKLTLTVNPLPLQATVSADSPKSFKAVFNKPVDTAKCDVDVTMNSATVPLNASWSGDGKTLSLQAQGNFAYGTYVIRLSGIGLATDTYTLDIKAPVLSAIALTTAFVTPNNDSAKLFMSGLDQYAQSVDVKASDFMWVVTDTTAQVVLPATAGDQNSITVQTNVQGVKVGDKLSVYAIGISNSALSMTAQVEVNSKSIDTLTLGSPVIPSGQKRLTVAAVPAYVEIPYTAIQNYTVNGNASQATAILDDLTETSLAQAVTLDNFIFTTDKPELLKNIKVVNGKLYVQVEAGQYGTARLTVSAIPAAGQGDGAISTSMIDISAPSIPDSLSIGQASGVLVNGGLAVKLPITILDQYGDIMGADAFAKTKFTDFTILSSNTAAATAVFDKDGTCIDLTPVGEGSSNITLVNKNSGKTAAYQAVVKAASVVKSFNYKLDYTAIAKGATAHLTLSTLDQYGNTLLSAPSSYKYTIAAQNGSTNVTLSAATLSVADAAANPVTITGIAPYKSEVITVTLYNDTNNNGKYDTGELVNAFAVTETVVGENDRLIYNVNALPAIYAAVAQDRNNSGLDQDAFGAIQNQNNKNSAYARTVTLKASLTDGTPVALGNNPITGITATLNPEIIDFSGKSGNDYVLVGRQWSGNELTRDANIAVSFVDLSGAQKTINSKVTVSKESLKATAIKGFINTGNDNDVSNDVEITNNSCFVDLKAFTAMSGRKLIENQNLTGVPVYFEVLDQYGVSSINPISITVTAKNSIFGAFSIDDSGVVTTNRFYSGETVSLLASDTEGHTIALTIKTK